MELESDADSKMAPRGSDVSGPVPELGRERRGGKRDE